MTQDQGFLVAICADPHDTGLRLIYADWLEEHDQQGRAEFIRVQCELAKVWGPESGECWQCHCARRGTQHTNGPCRCSSDFKALRRRERELLGAQGFQWFRDAFGYADIGWSYNGPASRNDWKFTSGKMSDHAVLKDCEFRRGFVEVVSCTCADWLKHGPAIVRAQPILEVKLTNLGYDHWLLLECPEDWARRAHLHLGLKALPPLRESHAPSH